MLVASHARPRIAGLVVGDLSALAQYLGRVPLHVALGCPRGAGGLGDLNARAKHRRIHGGV